MTWMVLVGIIFGVVVAGAVIYAATRRRSDPEWSNTMTGDQWLTLGIVFTGAGTALTASVGPAMLGMVALGLIYMAMGVSTKRKEGESS